MIFSNCLCRLCVVVVHELVAICHCDERQQRSNPDRGGLSRFARDGRSSSLITRHSSLIIHLPSSIFHLPSQLNATSTLCVITKI